MSEQHESAWKASLDAYKTRSDDPGRVERSHPTDDTRARARKVPDNFVIGSDKHNAAKAWLDGYDAAVGVACEGCAFDDRSNDPRPPHTCHQRFELEAPLEIIVTDDEAAQVRHAARLRHLSTGEYIKRAINASLRREGVDAVLLRESDDD
jgi:hypothetical protein